MLTPKIVNAILKELVSSILKKVAVFGLTLDFHTSRRLPPRLEWSFSLLDVWKTEGKTKTTNIQN